MIYRLADQQWPVDHFWEIISNIVEYAKSQSTEIDEERLVQVVLRDWLALAMPLGRS